MESQKIRQVIELYRRKFEELGIVKKDFPHDILSGDTEDALAHCYAKLEQMEKFIEEGRMDKVFRWLGFIQGVLWSHRIFNLAELKNHNRKDS